MTDIHPSSGSSYEELAQNNPMDVKNHPDNNLLQFYHNSASGASAELGFPTDPSNETTGGTRIRGMNLPRLGVTFKKSF